MQFPTVSGKNLDRDNFQLPRDLDGTLNVVLIAFQRWHQSLVDTWVPFLQQLEAEHPDLRYYELPTIYEMPTLSRAFINEGMRAGIPDETSRQRTITLYLDKESFKTALDIQTENQIHLFLVDTTGQILWSETGVYSEEKANELIDYLRSRSE